MKPADNINRLIKNSDVTTGSEIDSRILGDAFEELEKLKVTKLAGSRLNIRRIIMKTKITKLAAAAAIIIIAALGISLLQNSATTVYAIEQTIEAG